MAKTKEELILSPVEPTGEVRIDMAKEDLVTVGLVEIENELAQRHGDAKKRLQEHHKAKEELGKKQNQLVQKWSAAAAKEVLSTWLEPLKAALGTSRAKRVEAVVPLAAAKSDVDTQTVTVQLSERREVFPTGRGGGTIECRDGRNLGPAFTASYGAIFPVPAEVTAVAREQEALAKTIQQEEALILEIKQKLGNMNRYERQLRAELVKVRLASTEEGRKLLAVITQDLTERIGLPAPQ